MMAMGKVGRERMGKGGAAKNILREIVERFHKNYH
jgi:hypothetical protein